MPRYIEADNIEKELVRYADSIDKTQTFSGVLRLIVRDTPTADVRPVVYCKDCVYSSSWYRDKRLCTLWNEDGIDVFEDGFCNYGTKSDNEKQQKSKVDYLVCLTKMQTNICPNCVARMESENDD